MSDTRAAGIAALARTRSRASSAQPRARAGEQGLGWFVMPAQVEAKAAELGASFDSFDRAVQAYQPETAKAAQWSQWRAAWNDFRASWDALRSKIANEFFTRASGGTADLILQYQDRLAQWQSRFQTEWHAPLPGPPVEPVPAARNAPESVISWKSVATGVTIGVVTTIVLYGLKRVLP